MAHFVEIIVGGLGVGLLIGAVIVGAVIFIAFASWMNNGSH